MVGLATRVTREVLYLFAKSFISGQQVFFWEIREICLILHTNRWAKNVFTLIVEWLNQHSNRDVPTLPLVCGEEEKTAEKYLPSSTGCLWGVWTHVLFPKKFKARATVPSTCCSSLPGWALQHAHPQSWMVGSLRDDCGMLRILESHTVAGFRETIRTVFWEECLQGCMAYRKPYILWTHQ